MSFGTPNPWVTLMDAPRGTLAVGNGVASGAFRLPTDALFTATLTLRNVVSDSRFRVTRADNGDEVASGVVPGSGIVDHEVPGVQVFSNPMQVNITVRNASGYPAYRVFDTSTSIRRDGGEAFILQQLDE